LPRTPLFERLAREGRIVAGAAHGDNTKLGTNIVPKSMTVAQMVEGYKTLYTRLVSNGGIAERIRNKLRHFGTPARVRRERPREAIAIVCKLLARGIARGGVARAWHFVCSLPILRPHRLPLAINDWISGLAMRDYVDRHFAPARRPAQAAEHAAARLRRSLRRWLRAGAVKLALLRDGTHGVQIAVRVTGGLDAALARRLVRQARRVLARTQARLVLAIEGLRETERAEFERLVRALARYGDRAMIVLGEGMRDLLRVESADAPAAA